MPELRASGALDQPGRVLLEAARGRRREQLWGDSVNSRVHRFIASRLIPDRWHPHHRGTRGFCDVKRGKSRFIQAFLFPPHHPNNEGASKGSIERPKGHSRKTRSRFSSAEERRRLSALSISPLLQSGGTLLPRRYPAREQFNPALKESSGARTVAGLPANQSAARRRGSANVSRSRTSSSSVSPTIRPLEPKSVPPASLSADQLVP
jgi:hypothetical protein